MAGCVPGQHTFSLFLHVTFIIPPLLAVRNSSASCDRWHASPMGTGSLGPSLLQLQAKTSSVFHSRMELQYFLANATPVVMNGHVSFKAQDTTSQIGRFISSLVFNSIILFVHAVFFSVARSRNPKIYCNGWLTKRAPFQPGDGFFGWAIACWRLSPEEVIAAAGLDAAMMLRFQLLCAKIMAVLGLPMVVIMCPLHYFAGAGEGDPLSRITLTNIPDGSWLYWLHALGVWIVVVSVHRMLCDAQEEFVELRYRWLRTLPSPRSNTCLVQNIPAEVRTDGKLESYVNKLFMREVVERAYVIRKLPDYVLMEFNALQINREQLAMAEKVWKYTGNDPEKRPRHLNAVGDETDSIAHYRRMAIGNLEEYRKDQEVVMMQSKDGKFCACDGFVTFKRRHDAETALVMRARANADEIVFQMPPDPADVRYDVLQESQEQQNRKVSLGYVIMVLVFLSSFPVVIGIAFVSSLDPLRHLFPFVDVIATTYPVTASFWDGVFGSCLLTLFIAFVPILLMSIVRSLFCLPAESWCQHQLQHFYFHFQLIFALVIFCVGNSVFTLYIRFANNPIDILGMLASHLPSSANFYLNFYPLHWVAYFGQLCRYWVLTKYHFHKRTVDVDMASELAEPEDQDCYGFGARSARLSLLLAIAIVFCSMSPLICLMALITFFFSHACYGYLLVFAETKKTDTGGIFWCTQLKHVQYALFLYVALMVGIVEQSGGHGPGLCIFLSFVYLIRTYTCFDHDFPWVQLPFEEIAGLDATRKPCETTSYLQPQLAPQADLRPQPESVPEHRMA